MRLVTVPCVLLGGALLISGAGCHKKQQPKETGPTPLCSLASEAGDTATASSPRGKRNLKDRVDPRKKPPKGVTMVAVPEPEPEEWIQLLVRGYDGSGQVSEGAEDCTGQRIAWAEPDGCAEEPAVDAATQPIGGGALGENDIIQGRLKGNLRLVWLVTGRFDNGEGVGPVALVEVTAEALNVRAIGTLRAMPKRARLRLEAVGTHDVLVAEGEHCTDESAASCRRTVRVLVRRGDRFVAEPLVDRKGECVGQALFPLARDRTVTLDNGWARRFELNTTLTYVKGGLIKVHEQVVVHDLDPRKPEVPPRLFRKADGDRLIQVGERLSVNELSLWSRMLDDWASVDVPPKEESKPQ